MKKLVAYFALFSLLISCFCINGYTFNQDTMVYSPLNESDIVHYTNTGEFTVLTK